MSWNWSLTDEELELLRVVFEYFPEGPDTAHMIERVRALQEKIPYGSDPGFVFEVETRE